MISGPNTNNTSRYEKLPRGELRLYPDGRIDNVVKTPGLIIRMDALMDDLRASPVSADGGSIYVQTIEAEDANGTVTRRGHYYFDSRAMIDRDRGVGRALYPEDLTLDSRKITIDEPWSSPMGVTPGRVEAVVLPWPNGVDPETAVAGRESPTAAGFAMIEQFLAT